MHRSFAFKLAVTFALCLTVVTLRTTAHKRRQNVGNVNSPANSNASAPLPFDPTEELTYEVFYTKLLLRSINVAELSFISKRDPHVNDLSHAIIKAADANRPCDANFRLTMEMASKGIVPRLFGFRFHQRVESLVAPADFAVLRTTKLDEQNDRRRTSEAVFDKVAGKIVWTERNPKEPQRAPRVVASHFNHATQDIVSIFYFLRTQKLAPGLKLEVPLSDSGRTFRVPVTVFEGKRLKTTAFGEVSTLRVDVDVFGKERLLPGDGNLSIWFTDDARRIPVQARVTSSMGTLDVKLKSRTLTLKNTP